jgi:hypothetical protein
MFVENDSLRCIEADAQDVVAVYRSAASVRVAYGSREAQPCDAFVCVVQEDVTPLVYAALSLLNSKKFIILTPAEQPQSSDRLEPVLNDALAFLTDYGFAMQPVSLNYSKALKEVILSDLRVVRPIISTKKSSSRKASPEKATRSTPPAVEQKTDTKVVSPGQQGSGTATVKAVEKGSDVGQTGGQKRDKAVSPAAVPESDQGTEARAVARDLAAQQEARDRVLSAKAALEKETAQELARVCKEKDRITAEVAALEEKRAGELGVLRDELAKLKAEKISSAAGAEQEIAALQKQIAGFANEVQAEQQSAAEQLAQLQDKSAGLRAEKLELMEASARDMGLARTELATLSEELVALQQNVSDEQTALRLEIDSIAAEKTTLERERAQVISSLKAELASLVTAENSAAEVETLTEEVARLRQEKAEQRHKLETDGSVLRAEVERLREDQQLFEVSAGEELAGLDGECQRLISLHAELAQQFELERQAHLDDIERLRAEQSACAEAADRELSELRDTREQLSQELANSAQDMDRERDDLERELATLVAQKNQRVAAHTDFIAGLVAERDRLVAELTAVDLSFAEQQAKLHTTVKELEQQLADAKLQGEQQLAVLQGEHDRLVTEKTAAEKVADEQHTALAEDTARLQDELQSSRSASEQSIAALQAEIDQLISEKTALETRNDQEVSRLQDLVNRLSEEIAAARAAADAERDAAEIHAAQLSQELVALAATHQDLLTTLNGKIAGLRKERQALTDAAAVELAAVRGTVQQLISELMQTESTITSRVITARDTARTLINDLLGDAALADAYAEDGADQTQIAALQQQAEELAAANEAARVAGLAELASLRAVVTRLSAEKSLAEKAHAAELSALELEAELLLEGTSALASVANARHEETAVGLSNSTAAECPSAPCDPVDDAVDLTEEDLSAVVEELCGASQQNDEPIAITDPDVQDDDDADPFAFLNCRPEENLTVRPLAPEASGPPVTFRIDASLSCISYMAANDVTELYQSLNRTRVAMEDNTTVTCDAYLCAVKSSGRLNVFIALYLVDSKRVLVYVPERQPVDEGDCLKIIADGMDFIEIVGFMMDKIVLGKGNEDRTKIIGKVPVLCKLDA